MENEILEILSKSDKPMKSGEIAEIGGLDKAAVDKGIKQLKDADKIYSPKRCFYEVKK
jgi:DNA-binding transcriptional regulator GbsR (MarR family)